MEPISAVMAIQGAVDCVKGVLDGLKAVRDTDKALSLVGVREQVVELNEKLVNAKELTTELMQENQKLRAQLQLKDELQHDEDGNILWRDNAGKKEGPYCSTCYGAEEKLISLSGNQPGARHCPRCKNHFYTRQWDEEQLQKYRELNRR